uniref:phosphoserine phosphatase n=1 Tax=Araucaria cunninghamii TaxID=56994 RepID=A0A0D6QYH8_ARACU
MAGLSRAVFSDISNSKSTLLCPRHAISTNLSGTASFLRSDHRHFSISARYRSYNLVCSKSKNRAAGYMIRASGAQTSQTLPPAHKTSPSAEVLKIWHNADAVCFDVDSTVCIDEGIDELAEFSGAGEAVAAWTSRAMGGSVPFEEALAARLSLFRPSASVVANYLQRHPPRLNPGIQDLVKNLKAKGVDVYLVSGGFRQMIEPVAALLEIPCQNIYANRLLFGNEGEYVGFDPEEPTSRSGGKATAVAKIKKEHGYKTLVMVGDGATDLEARQPGGADLFICYGGIQLRSKVAQAADWFVLSFDNLIKELNSTT